MSDDGKKAVWDFAKGYIKTFCNQVSFGGKVISGIGQYLHEGAEVAKNYLDDENVSIIDFIRLVISFRVVVK